MYVDHSQEKKKTQRAMTMTIMMLNVYAVMGI